MKKPIMENLMYTNQEEIILIAQNRFNTWKEIVENYWAEQGHPLPSCLTQAKQPLSFLSRHVAVANNESIVFVEKSNEMGLQPLWSEYLKDYYVTASARKTLLLRPKNYLGQKMRLIKNHEAVNKLPLDKIYFNLNNEETSIVDYHHSLWEEKVLPLQDNLVRYDFSDWLKGFGRAKDYYFADFTLSLGHGVLFKNFHGDTNSQSWKSGFTQEIAIPAFERVMQEFGEKPMVYKFMQEEHFPYLLE